MKKISHIVALSGLALALQAQAFTISPMLVYMSPGSAVQDISITNTDSKTEYVQVSVKSLSNPGNPTVPGVQYTTSMKPKDFGLMVTPNKLAVSAGEIRKVRLVGLEANLKKDKVYDILFNNIKNVPGLQPAAKGAGVVMDMNYSYTVRVIILPSNPLPVVTAKRNGLSVTISNTGNSYISLRNGQLCDTSGKNCAALPSATSYHALYAGDSWSFKVAQPGVIKFYGVYAETKNMPVVVQ